MKKRTLKRGISLAFLIITGIILGTHNGQSLLTPNPDQEYNATAPNAEIQALMNLVGYCGTTPGTLIGPDCFGAIRHNTGSVSNIFVFDGVPYRMIEYIDTGSRNEDIRIWRVDHPFPRWAYVATNVTWGSDLVILGNGYVQGRQLMCEQISTNWINETRTNTVIESTAVQTNWVTMSNKTNYLKITVSRLEAAIIKFLIPSAILTPLPPKGATVSVAIPSIIHVPTTNVAYTYISTTNTVIETVQIPLPATNTVTRGWMAAPNPSHRLLWGTGKAEAYNTNYVVSAFRPDYGTNCAATVTQDSGGPWFAFQNNRHELVGFTAGNQSPWREYADGSPFDAGLYIQSGLYRGTNVINVPKATNEWSRSFGARADKLQRPDIQAFILKNLEP